jgi:hypothetical protein
LVGPLAGCDGPSLGLFRLTPKPDGLALKPLCGRQQIAIAGPLLLRPLILWHTPSMPTRSSTSKRQTTDPILVAKRIFEKVTGEPTKPPAREKNKAAVALGKLGGAKGGKARAAKLSAKRRSEIARKAAKARWR